MFLLSFAVLDLHFDSAADITPLGKIQIARAIGVAIVKQGSMYPTMELLLRHAIQYLGLRGKSLIALPGTLDSEDGFIVDLEGIDPEDPDTPGLTKEEQVVVLSIHLLALMLDGARRNLCRARHRCRLTVRLRRCHVEAREGPVACGGGLGGPRRGWVLR